MSIARKKEAHIWERDPHDWYVEPLECSLALFDLEIFSGTIWDPACGMGRIVQAANLSKLDAYGSDFIKRPGYSFDQLDFLFNTPQHPFDNIVTNPPYSKAEDFVHRALSLIKNGKKVALILPLVWLSGFSSKRDWLPDSPLKKIFPISPRPSMPPAAVIQAGIRPGNGTKDYAWFVWQNGYQGAPQVEFMNTNRYKHDTDYELELA